MDCGTTGGSRNLVLELIMAEALARAYNGTGGFAKSVVRSRNDILALLIIELYLWANFDTFYIIL